MRRRSRRALQRNPFSGEAEDWLRVAVGIVAVGALGFSFWMKSQENAAAATAPAPTGPAPSGTGT
jgi:hypothetical protein